MQRLSFNDFYQLDKTGSQEADDGKGNLVLLYQGIEPFARKVLNVDEKRAARRRGRDSRILGLEGSTDLGMPGVKKALAARGFDARDIILKKWSEFGPPEPAVLTYDENKLDQLDQQIAELENSVKRDAEQVQAWTEEQKKWQTAPLAELPKTRLAKQFEIKEANEALRKEVLQKLIEPNLSVMQLIKEQNEQELQGVRKDRFVELARRRPHRSGHRAHQHLAITRPRHRAQHQDRQETETEESRESHAVAEPPSPAAESPASTPSLAAAPSTSESSPSLAAPIEEDELPLAPGRKRW